MCVFKLKKDCKIYHIKCRLGRCSDTILLSHSVEVIPAFYIVCFAIPNDRDMADGEAMEKNNETFTDVHL